MACNTVARPEGFTLLDSLDSYSIFLSTLCPNRIGAISQSQAIFHIHLKRDAVMMMIIMTMMTMMMVVMVMMMMMMMMEGTVSYYVTVHSQ